MTFGHLTIGKTIEEENVKVPCAHFGKHMLQQKDKVVRSDQ